MNNSLEAALDLLSFIGDYLSVMQKLRRLPVLGQARSNAVRCAMT